MKTDKELAVDIVIAIIQSHPTLMSQNGRPVTVLQPSGIPAILEKIYKSIPTLDNSTKENK